MRHDSRDFVQGKPLSEQSVLSLALQRKETECSSESVILLLQINVDRFNLENQLSTFYSVVSRYMASPLPSPFGKIILYLYIHVITSFDF